MCAVVLVGVIMHPKHSSHALDQVTAMLERPCLVLIHQLGVVCQLTHSRAPGKHLPNLGSRLILFPCSAGLGSPALAATLVHAGGPAWLSSCTAKQYGLSRWVCSDALRLTPPHIPAHFRLHTSGKSASGIPEHASMWHLAHVVPLGTASNQGLVSRSPVLQCARRQFSEGSIVALCKAKRV